MSTFKSVQIGANCFETCNSCDSVGKWAFTSLFFFFFYFCLFTVNSKNLQYKILLMTGFEPQTSGIGSNCSVNWATTATQVVAIFFNISWPILALKSKILKLADLHFRPSSSSCFCGINFRWSEKVLNFCRKIPNSLNKLLFVSDKKAIKCYLSGSNTAKQFWLWNQNQAERV